MTEKKKQEKQTDEPTGLALMRMPFPKHLISKLPKPTQKQTDEVKNNPGAGIRCSACGGWHHPKVVHLDYVGHAALTSRLLDCDPEWNWEPVRVDECGAPVFDQNGGMWIRLTVCGVTRLGYGDAQGKKGGNAIKEAIGDALRNAAMRFGAALDLWHKGDLHSDENEGEGPPQFNPAAARDRIKAAFSRAESLAELKAMWRENAGTIKMIKDEKPAMHAEIEAAKDEAKARLETQAKQGQTVDLGGDEIPY